MCRNRRQQWQRVQPRYSRYSSELIFTEALLQLTLCCLFLMAFWPHFNRLIHITKSDVKIWWQITPRGVPTTGAVITRGGGALFTPPDVWVYPWLLLPAPRPLYLKFCYLTQAYMCNTRSTICFVFHLLRNTIITHNGDITWPLWLCRRLFSMFSMNKFVTILFSPFE